jgi:hypothetical protein
MSPVAVDFSGAFHKTAALKALPKAERHIIGQWASDTVQILKRRAAGMQTSVRQYGGKKTGQLARNIGFVIKGGEGVTVAEIGTGVGGTQSVKYAMIQDEGGVTHPKVTEKMRKWAWAMYYQEFGREIRGMHLRGAERRGAKETYRAIGNKYMAIALTKQPTLTVRVPASHWFSAIAEARIRDLEEAMKPENQMKVAEGMASAQGL